ncbi:MAG: hypothetical protein HZY79_11480 [Rhodoblastus sp.]|nr:MAG: hypothetical protein HZY79_11480 [Rhodoblastus sp.]
MSALSDLFGQSSTLRTLGVTCVVIAGAAMAATALLDKVSSGQMPGVALVRPDGTVTYFGGAAAKIASTGVDMTPVGAINKVVVDPCAGKPK